MRQVGTSGYQLRSRTFVFMSATSNGGDSKILSSITGSGILVLRGRCLSNSKSFICYVHSRVTIISVHQHHGIVKADLRQISSFHFELSCRI